MKTITNPIKILLLLLCLFGVTALRSQCPTNFTATPYFNGNGYVQFSIPTTTVTASSYTWQFGNGTSSVMAFPSYSISNTYTANGVYIATLSIASGTCNTVLNQTVIVNTYTAPCVANANFVFSYAPNGVVNFTNQSVPSAGVSYSWNFGNSTTSTLSYNSVTYTPNGPYMVTLTVSTSPTCTSTISQSVSITNAGCGLNANFWYSQGGNGNVNFSNFTTGTVTATNYTINYGDASPVATNTAFGALAAHNYTANGSYTVTLTARNSSTCSSTASVVVNVTSNCISPGLIYSIGNNGAVTFSNTTTTTSTNTPSYTLSSFGASPGFIQTSSTLAAMAFTSNGTYTVYLNAFANPCSGSTMVVISISNVTCNINAGLAYSQGANGLVNFSNTSTGTVSGATYTLSFGDSTPGTTLIPTSHTYASNGTYIATLTANNNGTATCISTNTFAIVVNSFCSFTTNFNYGFWPAGLVAFNALPSSTMGVTYSWGFGNGNFSTTATPTINNNYANNGVYSVTLQAVQGACTATAVQTITVVTFGCLLNANAYYTPGANGLATFSNTTTGAVSGISYAWNFGDGSATNTLTSPAHTYTANGSYVATLTAVFGTTCTSTKTLAVNISNVLSCSVTAGFTYGISGGTVTFTNTTVISSGTLNAYFWQFGDGNISNSSNPAHTYTANGVYSVSLTAIVGSCTNTAVMSLTLTTVPVCLLSANYTYSLNTAQPGVAYFTNASTGTVAGSTYSWNFGDGSPTNTLASPSHSYAANGVYTVTLTANNNFTPSCVSTITYTVLVNTYCNLVAGFNYTVNGATVTFSNTTTASGTVNTYSWDFNDGNFSNAINPVHTYTATGIYLVSLTANMGSCTNTAVQSMTVTIPTACTVTAGFTHTVSSSGLVNFSDASIGTTSNTTYQWNFGDGWTSGNQNPAHTYGSAGSYTVFHKVVDLVGSCSDSIIQVVNVTGIPCVANSSFSLTPTATLQYWDIMPSSPWNITNAEWTWGDGGTSNTLYASHQYTAAGNYNICLSVTVSCGNTSSTCATYSISRVSSAAAIIYVSVKKPTNMLETAITEVDANILDYSIYPNPNDGLFRLNITGSEDAPVKINVCDILGKNVLECVCLSANEKQDKELDLRSVPAGVYFVSVSSGSRSYTKKIVVAK